MYDAESWPPPPDVEDVQDEAQRLAAEALHRAATFTIERGSVRKQPAPVLFAFQHPMMTVNISQICVIDERDVLDERDVFDERDVLDVLPRFQAAAAVRRSGKR